MSEPRVPGWLPAPVATTRPPRLDRTGKHIAMENRLSPMRELLGEMLLETGDPAAALREFEASLKAAPNRYRSFAGAAKAAERSGDREAARRWHGRLLELTAEADTERPEMVAARRFLAESGARGG
jgi:Tfp pilus assembly protein PilF